MGTHAEGVQSWVIGQGDRDRWRLTASMRMLIDEVAHGAQVGRIFGQRGGDGRFKRCGAVGVEQLK
jgi:hypothetical protein